MHYFHNWNSSLEKFWSCCILISRLLVVACNFGQISGFTFVPERLSQLVGRILWFSFSSVSLFLTILLTIAANLGFISSAHCSSKSYSYAIEPRISLSPGGEFEGSVGFP